MSSENVDLLIVLCAAAYVVAQMLGLLLRDLGRHVRSVVVGVPALIALVLAVVIAAESVDRAREAEQVKRAALQRQMQSDAYAEDYATPRMSGGCVVVAGTRWCE